MLQVHGALSYARSILKSSNSMSPLPFSPARRELAFRSMSVDSHGITIHMSMRREAVPAASAQHGSIAAIHTRTLADLPWHDTAVEVSLWTRRFFCDHHTCVRRIFAERLPDRSAVSVAEWLKMSPRTSLLPTPSLRSQWIQLRDPRRQ